MELTTTTPRVHRSRAPFRRVAVTSLLGTFTIAFGLAISFALSLTLPDRASAQIGWMNLEDGDILNVSRADGLTPGYLSFHFRRSLERSDEHGQLLIHHFGFEYGLTPMISMGGSGRHLKQLQNDLYKDGLGDSDLFLKIYHKPWAGVPVSLGLRQTLTLPTGYEAERDGLTSFTSRTYDYAAQGLISYRTERLGLHLNPGVILPGGDAPSFLTAGFAMELDDILPFGVDVTSEYFTRWNMVEREFQSDVYLGAHRSLFWGIALEGGVKRRLLETDAVQPEAQIGLSFGRVHDASADLSHLPPPRYPSVDLAVLPVESRIPDPWGIRELLSDEFRIAGDRQQRGVPILIHTVPEGYSSPARYYGLRIRVLSVNDGEIRGPRIPMVFQAPQARAAVHVEAELLGPDGIPLGRQTVFDGAAQRGLGAEVFPLTVDYEQRVVPDEIREGLRREAVRNLARALLATVTDVISERESR
ncbi:MAG: hypothetical protein R3E12_10025 [Candidatus Eisenbacteria bacterium]